MGLLVDGVWRDKWYDTKSSGGKFVRQDSAFRNWITADGAPGPSGSGGFKAEVGRYHLYAAHACPWAHRAVIMRALKGLEDAISLTWVDPLMLENGWEIPEGADPIHNAQYLYQVYTAADPNYTGRVTVPTLWDREKGTIVSNESAEIIRMLNSAFREVSPIDYDFAPAALLSEIDDVNTLVYDAVNNGVYKSGFATSQSAYDEAVRNLFAALDQLEGRLSQQRFLCGARLTESDLRLFTTLIRFDPVYHGHFKCNRRQLRGYPALWGHTAEIYGLKNVAGTVDMAKIMQHYYASHRTINPTGIVPVGPDPLLPEMYHGRGHLPGDPHPF